MTWQELDEELKTVGLTWARWDLGEELKIVGLTGHSKKYSLEQRAKRDLVKEPKTVGLTGNR